MSEAQTVDIKELLAELIACAGVFDVSTEYEADKAELEKATQAVLQYTQTLRDERDRLRATIRTLCSSGNRLLDDLIGRSDAAESFKYHIKQAQAALTPAGGGQDDTTIHSVG